jgi:hypothetical protein
MIRGVTHVNRKGPRVIDNSSATVVRGLEGMAVRETDGEPEYAIEATQRIGWCPVCGLFVNESAVVAGRCPREGVVSLS